VQRGALGVEGRLDHAAPGLGEADPNHAPIGGTPQGPNQPASVQLVNHEGDTRLRRLDELSEIALHAPLASGGARLEEEVVLDRAQVVLRERPVDLDHRLPETAPEDRREP
jgi:hypothetical protein